MRFNENAGARQDAGSQTLPPNNTQASIAHTGPPNKPAEPFRISTAQLETFYTQFECDLAVPLRSTAMAVTMHCPRGNGIVIETSSGPAVGLREVLTFFQLS